jgi:cellulose synthase/poly-beta-1,6-N-acetylglucosamine synthase-like glycosyltransferase
MLRLGDILVEDGAITRSDIEDWAPRARGKLGDWLKTHQRISPRDLARALARQQGLNYIELNHTQPDAALFQSNALNHYIAQRYVPLQRDGNLLTVACCEPSRTLIDEIIHRTGLDVRLCVTTQRDINQYLARVGGHSLTRRARLNLRRRYPTLTAFRTLMPEQARGLSILLAAFLIAFAIDMNSTWQTMVVVCNLFYFCSLAFKLQLYLQGASGARSMRRLEKKLIADVAVMEEATLPLYSILVPLYRESADVMARLIASLSALDYPKEKLDIKLICESDDAVTIEALQALKPPAVMEIIRVPPSYPRTKPKACNVALQQIRGEYVVIYDAEDAPASDQLKRAIALFRAERDDVACLQAPLNYYNRNENMLTKLFALEYSTLFRMLLPALERMDLPIPLGGTSNHLKVAALLQAGGWDAFNVTEDADLGIRLRYFGYRTRILPSLTLEEAPHTVKAWLKQRTRWIKGYIQTWLVYMRDPAELKRRLGKRAYYGFQFFVGAPALTFLLAPILWGIFILAPLGILPTKLTGTLLAMCWISFIGGVVSNLMFARAAVAMERWSGMERALLVFPFYWLLHSVACARAIWQLARAPHYWEKTTHGVSRMFRN